MKLTVCGDPHITKNRLENIKKLFQKLESFGHPVVLLGDQLDTKSVIDGYCLDFLINFIKNSKLFWIIIVGNHDYFSLHDCKEHSMEPLKGLGNCLVIDSLVDLEKAFNEGQMSLGSGDFYACPYIHEQEKIKEVIKTIPKNSVVFGHWEIPGFDFGNGHMCSEGVPETSFKKFKKVVSGHFHKYQTKGNICYLGTPFSKDFGESNQEKYIGIFDTETSDLELISTKEWFPQHKTIQWDASQGVPTVEVGKDVVRVVLKGTAEEIAAIPRIEGVRYDEQPKDDSFIEIKESDDFLSQFQEWGSKKLDDATLKTGLEILKGVADVHQN